MNREEAVTFMMLPNDLVLNCLARVSRLYYPTLSLVCKKFRSMLVSRELCQTRTLLGRTDTCLYVCLKPYNSYDYGGIIPQRWFILYQRPGSSKKVLVPITSPNSPSTYKSSCASVGSNIYVIGGLKDISNESSTSSVMVMDCRSHTWREAPSMQLARCRPSVCVLDEKIYVTGGRDWQYRNATNWMEVFDTKTQTWEFELSGPDENTCSDFTSQSVGYDGAVYVRCCEEHTTYKLNKGIWSAADLHLAMSQGWDYPISYCVIDNLLYRYSSGVINWYDSEQRSWNALKGLKSFSGDAKVKVVGYGGKLAVFSVYNISDMEFRTKNIICCTEITLEKRKDGKIWGKLEWTEAVSTTDVGSDVIAHVVVATF